MPLDYAVPDAERPLRDPMSYYREPPSVSELTLSGLLIVFGVLALILLGFLAWRVA